jgi:hypothetical protein
MSDPNDTNSEAATLRPVVDEGMDDFCYAPGDPRTALVESAQTAADTPDTDPEPEDLADDAIGFDEDDEDEDFEVMREDEDDDGVDPSVFDDEDDEDATEELPADFKL